MAVSQTDTMRILTMRILILHEQLETQLQSKSYTLVTFSIFGKILLSVIDANRPYLKFAG